MLRWYNWTTFDMVGDFPFGESLDCLENARTDPWIQAVFGDVKSVPFIGSLRRCGLDGCQHPSPRRGHAALSTRAEARLPQSAGQRRRNLCRWIPGGVSSNIITIPYTANTSSDLRPNPTVRLQSRRIQAPPSLRVPPATLAR